MLACYFWPVIGAGLLLVLACHPLGALERHTSRNSYLSVCLRHDRCHHIISYHIISWPRTKICMRQLHHPARQEKKILLSMGSCGEVITRHHLLLGQSLIVKFENPHPMGHRSHCYCSCLKTNVSAYYYWHSPHWCRLFEKHTLRISEKLVTLL